jgi:DNA invertase Pin-like site-specific DNA recombinase/DNA-binding XRE family transcriptional regulator
MADVAIYVRLSDEDRDKTTKEDDSESIKNQRSMLYEYASDKGWNVFNIYVDEDYSGSDSSRPAFNQMIKDASKQCFQIVLCKSLSRFARDVAVVETYIYGRFIEWGVRFISVTDYTDSSLKSSKKNIQINSLINQWYLEDLSENIRATLTHKKKQGQFVASMTPFGYIKNPDDKHKLIIDPEAANTVKRIFAMYIEGMGSTAIAKMLNKERVENPHEYRLRKGIPQNQPKEKLSGLMWNDSIIFRMLNNPNYTGDLVQCRYYKPSYKSKCAKKQTSDKWVVVENAHEAIISKNDYELVQKLRQSKWVCQDRKSASFQNVFTGIVKCALCGSSLIWNPSDRKHDLGGYLRCGGKRSGNIDCKCAQVRYKQLYAIVEDRLRQLIAQHLNYNNANNRLLKKSSGYDTELLNLKNQISKNLREQNKINDALSSTYLDKTSGLISEQQFVTISSKLSEKSKCLNDEYDFLIANKLKVEQLICNESNSIKIIDKYKNFVELDRDIVRKFIDVIYIGERDDTKNIRIGDRLKALRNETGKTSRQVANELEFDRSAYSCLENNKTSPRLYNLKKLCEYYNVSVEYMLGNSDAKNEDGNTPIPNVIIDFDVEIVYKI